MAPNPRATSRRPSRLSILGLATIGVASACGSATPAPEAPAAPSLDEATYTSVLDAVFDGMEEEARTLAGRGIEVEEARRRAGHFDRRELGRRFATAARAHEITAEQMAGFAVDHPGVVRRINRRCAQRMRRIRATVRATVANASATRSALAEASFTGMPADDP
jgi:hypothetical protein